MSETHLGQTKTPYEIGTIEDGAQRGWTLEVDGKVIEPKQFTLINERFGAELRYGKRQEGYDGFVIREHGGSVTLPYTFTPDGQILVGLIDEYRPTTGQESTLNAPRGMANVNENRQETAVRETLEETGHDAKAIGSKVVEMARDITANSTYFDTSVNEGTAFYSMEVPTDKLELRHDADGNLYYAFPDRLQDIAEDAVTERIYGTKFVTIADALQSKDMFTGYAVGQLLGSLLKDGNYIVPQSATLRNHSHLDRKN